MYNSECDTLREAALAITNYIHTYINDGVVHTTYAESIVFTSVNAQPLLDACIFQLGDVGRYAFGLAGTDVLGSLIVRECVLKLEADLYICMYAAKTFGPCQLDKWRCIIKGSACDRKFLHCPTTHLSVPVLTW